MAASGNLVVDGYPIYEEFEEIYHRLYGPLYVGKPLSQPRFNANGNRIEQYFQNVGFYRNIDDQPGDVYLLAYGVFACSSDCRFSPPQSTIVAANLACSRAAVSFTGGAVGWVECFRYAADRSIRGAGRQAGANL